MARTQKLCNTLGKTVNTHSRTHALAKVVVNDKVNRQHARKLDTLKAVVVKVLGKEPNEGLLGQQGL